MARQKTLLTAEEFFRLYSHKDGRFELVDGEVLELAPVNEEHGEVAFNINGAFHHYSRRFGIGRGGVETGYRVRQSPDVVRGPDVSFNVRNRREGEKPLRTFVPGAPDIAVEVVSPSNTATDMTRKVSEYLEAGSQRVWAVYPTTRTVSVHRADGTTVAFTGEDVITDEELLPGFSLPLTEIFR